MKQLLIKPEIHSYDSCENFVLDFKLGKNDLIITSNHTYNTYFKAYDLQANVIFLRNYGTGEPSDEMVESIYKDIKNIAYDRVIAIGGGSILDVSKLFALENICPVVDLFDKKLPIKKTKKLILIPTTCGTGSEVTNISILELKARNTKLGLALDELYADCAVLIPELLESLPFEFFATSAIDALIHAIESYVSPKATAFTEMYSLKAMEILLTGFEDIENYGPSARFPLLKDFLLASTYAGIAFGNAGCGAVHAMSYPLGAKHHVAHGEANYQLFIEVFKTYERLNPYGKLAQLNNFLANVLHCNEAEVYDRIEQLLLSLIPKKILRQYGVTEAELKEFTENVMLKQGRLMANNYVELGETNVYSIYKAIY